MINYALKTPLLLIFLHIPKTAGTTLHTIIERQFPPNAIFSIDWKHVATSVNELKNISPSKRQEILCLRGHMPFWVAPLSLPAGDLYHVAARPG